MKPFNISKYLVALVLIATSCNQLTNSDYQTQTSSKKNRKKVRSKPILKVNKEAKQQILNHWLRKTKNPSVQPVNEIILKYTAQPSYIVFREEQVPWHVDKAWNGTFICSKSLSVLAPPLNDKVSEYANEIFQSETRRNQFSKATLHSNKRKISLIHSR